MRLRMQQRRQRPQRPPFRADTSAGSVHSWHHVQMSLTNHMPLETIPERLAACRAALQAQQANACLIPSSDPHLSEYLPGHWQGREWLSGFTGSSGTLLVGLNNAALFTDSRYWEQAEAELAGSGIDLVKLQGPANPAYAAWLVQQSPQNPGTLMADGQVLGLATAQALKEALAKVGWQLRTDTDPLAPWWADRPDMPSAPVWAHEPPHACVNRSDKLRGLAQAMSEHRATHHWLSTLDDVAWLLNLRGSDVDYNPVFLAHALVQAPAHATVSCAVKLFVGEGKVSPALSSQLLAEGIEVCPYEHAREALQQLPAGSRLLLDPKRVTLGLRQCVPAHTELIEAINPSTLAKSRKTEAEAAFIREAMARDGAAMCEFYAWLEQALGREHVSELTIDEQLTAARARQPDFLGLSFPTIAGFNANGALPHYRATPTSFATLSTPQGLCAQGLLLIDSGGQYLGGTTDITRVWAIGTPTADQKRDFTLVLKGTMALSRTRFPKGTLSPMLDAMARAPLWEHGLDFGHGTGHGVGYCLNVHEGPQSISKAVPDAHMAMQPGMVTSIEPGLYRPGKWGIRIENLVLNVVVPPTVPNAAEGEPEHGDYLAFETLSLCPIDTRCIDVSLLRDDELQWLNGYHDQVRQRLAPMVSGPARAWLDIRTQPLSRG